MAKHWYSYLGPNNPTVTQATAVSNYFYTGLYGTQISAACLAGPRTCVIYATGDEASAPGPLSANIKQYIANSLLTSTAQPTTGPKRYVYAKPNN